MERKKIISTEEIDDILNVIKNLHGYDFTSYARASMQRRIHKFMDEVSVKNAEELKGFLINTQGAFDLFVGRITVNVTEMFRDPGFYKAMRSKVITMLSSYPSIKIWHAGCSTGEEVFSMAILLYEAGLLQRTRIYATDINPFNLEKAKKGIVPQSAMKDYTANYLGAGGLNDFASYYTARYDNVMINKELRQNIVFAQHNLVTDQVFNEFQLICCRNVLIYFNPELQNKVVNLFYESLSPLGYLVLGSKESLLFGDKRNAFAKVDTDQKIYRRKH